MVEYKAEDRPGSAFRAEAKRDDRTLHTPSCFRLSPGINIYKLVRILLLGLSCSTALLCGCSQAPRTASRQALVDCHRAESQRFVLYSDPWINLHHFLFEWARNVPERQPGDRRRPVGVPERAQVARLDAGERQTWEHALAFYRDRWVPRNLVLDEDLIRLRSTLAEISCTAAGPDRIPADTREVLADAMAVYRRHWWPDHHARNLKLRDELLVGLREHESVLAERIAQAYGGGWPSQRIRVDISAYADWSGAYTTNAPDHVVLTSTTNSYIAGLNALEMLFHEVSHAAFFEEPFTAELEAAFRAQGSEVPDGLTHVFQWITPAELLRSHLSGEELRDFRPYAERSELHQRSRTTAQRDLLEENWVPFLGGKITRKEALNRIAAALASHRTAVWHKGVIAV